MIRFRSFYVGLRVTAAAALFAFTPTLCLAQGCAGACATEAPVRFMGHNCAQGPFTVTLNSVQVEGSGSSCGAYSDTSWGTAMLKMDTDYTLNSTNSCSHHIALECETCGVQILVDGSEATYADAASYGGPGDKPFTLRLTRKRTKGESAGTQTGFRGGVDSPSGLPNTATIPLSRWSASLGNAQDGFSAGEISMIADLSTVTALTESLFSVAVASPGPKEDPQSPEEDPRLLIVNDPSTGTLRQVVVFPEDETVTIVHLVKSATTMEVRFHTRLNVTKPSSGLWTIPAGDVPAVTYVFTLAVSGGQRNLKVVERRPGTQNTLVDAATNSINWNGTSLENTAGSSTDPQRVTTVTTSSPLTVAEGGSRTETTLTLTAQQAEIRRVERVITRFAWGEETTEERIGPVGDASRQITRYGYFSSPQAYGYTKLEWIIRPGGDWNRFEYNHTGALSGTYSPWKSSPASPADATSANCVYETVLYHGVVSNDILKRSKRILGEEVSSTSHSAPALSTFQGHVVIVSQESAAGQPTRTSAVFSLSNPEPWRGRPAWSEDGFGGRTVYQYERGTYDTDGKFVAGTTGFERRETVELVRGGDGGGVVKHVSTKTERLFKREMLISEISHVHAEDGYHPVRRLRYEYDGKGRPHRTWTASATASGQFSTGVERVLQETEYQADGRVLRETDAYGSVTEYQYDSLGRVFRRIKPAKAGQPAWYEEMEYDAEGRTVAQWRVAGTAPVTGTTTPSGAVRTLRTTAYNAYGEVISETDPSGLVMARQSPVYLTAGGRDEVQIPPSGIAQTTRYFRDGQVDKAEYAAGTDADDPSPEGHYFDYSTGSGGTVVTTEFFGASGTSTPASHFSRTFSKGDGRVISVERPAFSASGSPTGISYQRSGYDSLGRTVSVLTGAEVSTASVLTGAEVPTLTEYDAALFGAMVRQGRDVNGNGKLDPNSLEPITEYETRTEQIDGNWWRVSRSWQYSTDNASTRILLGETRQQLTGLSSSRESVTVTVNAAGRMMRETTMIFRNTATVNQFRDDITAPSNPVGIYSSSYANGNPTLQTLYPLAEENPSLEATVTSFDGLGRVSSTNHPARGTINYYYKTRTATVGGSAVTVQTPQVDYEESGLTGDRNRLYYTYVPNGQPGAGQVASKYVARATAPSTALESWRYAYNRQGGVRYQWGSSAYPVSYVFNAAGQMIKMSTYRSFPGASAHASSWPAAPGVADNTVWEYDPYSRLLLSKADPRQTAASKKVAYTYTADGKPLTRKWARSTTGSTTNPFKLTTTYSYDSLGRQRGTSYNRASTPSVAYTYDRMGRLLTISDGSGFRALSTNAAGKVESAAYSRGFLNGVTVSTPVGASGFTKGMDLGAVVTQIPSGGGTAAEIYRNDYGYDASGHFSSVTFAGKKATYGYWPNVNSLIGSITFGEAAGGGSTLTLSSAYDAFGRLQSRAARVSGSSSDITSLQYPAFDHMNRRKTVVRSEPPLGGSTLQSSNWEYGYNARGEVQSGTKRAGATGGSGTPFPGASYGYTFDSIGNRSAATQKTFGQSDDVTTTWTPGAANIWTSVTNPSQLWITGEAAASPVSLSVDGGSAVTATVSSPNSIFGQRVAAGNATAPQRLNLQVSQGTDITKGSLFTPAVSVTPTYDDDGNLLTDGLWVYTWDAENRLQSVETDPALTTAAERVRHVYVYDSEGRRVRDIRYQYSGSAWTAVSSVQWIYDGWNCLVERQDNGTVLKSYAWGLDLAASRTATGGVGALLFVRTHATIGTEAPSTSIAAADGNGNVTHLFDATDKTLKARYDYSPFGEAILTAGPRAYLNPFRFSSKYTDPETGLCYYGYRYYNPWAGSWVNRDPIGERGGENLYGAVGNNPINQYDLLGMKWKEAPKAQQPENKYRIVWVSDSEKDTLEDLAQEIGLDPKESKVWARNLPKGDPKSKNHCPVSVPNIWIDANLLHGGGIKDRFINLGGFFGRAFTFSGKKEIKVNHAKDLVGVIQAHKHDIIGFSLYAHGAPDGTIAMPNKIIGKTEEGVPIFDLTRYTDQTSVLAALDQNGFKLAKAYVMQCYSGFNGIYNGVNYNWPLAWSQRVYGNSKIYSGVNALGIDFGG